MKLLLLLWLQREAHQRKLPLELEWVTILTAAGIVDTSLTPARYSTSEVCRDYMIFACIKCKILRK